MSQINIIRAWKDAGYRNSLTPAQRAQLPPHPAGAVDLTEEELGTISGGREFLKTTMECYSVRTSIVNCGGCP